MVSQCRFTSVRPDGSKVHTGWVDLNNQDQFDYIKNLSDDVKNRMEYRRKPNIFTRIKEWWNNE